MVVIVRSGNFCGNRPLDNGNRNYLDVVESLLFEVHAATPGLLLFAVWKAVCGCVRHLLVDTVKPFWEAVLGSRSGKPCWEAVLGSHIGKLLT